MLKNLEKVIDKKFISQRVYYLVRWRDGRPDEWLPRTDVVAVYPKKIAEYECKQAASVCGSDNQSTFM